MSFFWKRGGSQASQIATPTHQSEAERLRSRQLSSLCRAGGQAVNHEQSIFDVPIHLPDKRVLYLRITLPDSFPIQPPLVQTTSQVQHQWLDGQMRVVGHADLNSWSAHSDLGRIVTDISREFMRNPPNMGPAPATMTRPAVSEPPAASPPAVVKSQERRQSTQTPAIPAVFPELEDLSLTELEDLVANKSALKAYVRKVESVSNFLKFYDDITKGNTELATTNLSYESTIEKLHVSIGIKKAELQQESERLQEKQQQQQVIMAKFQPQALVERVSKAAAEADEESEDIAYAFTNGELPINEFVSKYLALRTKYHLRTAKVTRFSSH